MFKIVNKSENWRIAKLFINGSGEKVAKSIAEKVLLNCNLPNSTSIEYELFWKGYRDYCDHIDGKGRNVDIKDRALQVYNAKFKSLRAEIEKYNASYFPRLNLDDCGRNYTVSSESIDDFFRNLYNTEIDIVIRAGDCFLIGEVKHTQSFSADSGHILVHQLLRQYVVASIILEEISRMESKKFRVIPFIIADGNAKNTGQIKLLQHLGWLNEKNIFSWSSFECE